MFAGTLLPPGGLSRSQYNEIAEQAFQVLAKAVTSSEYVGSDPFAAPNQTTAALQVENLQSLMTTLTPKLYQLVLYQDLYKSMKTNVNWSYNEQSDLGGSQLNPFVNEGSPGLLSGTTRTRRPRTIKYLAESAEVSLVAQLQELGGFQQVETELPKRDLISGETNSRTQSLLINLEKMLWHGDSQVLGATSFDGLMWQMINKGATDSVVADQIIDLHGRDLDPEFIEAAMGPAADNGLLPDRGKLYAPTDTLVGLSNQYRPKERVAVRYEGQGGQMLMAGTPVGGMHTLAAGQLEFRRAVFLQRPEVKDGVPTSNRGVPASGLSSPQSVTATASGSATSGSEWYTEDQAAVYYTVTSIDDGGEIATGTKTTVAATGVKGESISLSIAHPASGTPTGFRIYRGLKSDGSDHKFVQQVVAASSSPTTHVDLNYFLPGTNFALMLDPSPETLEAAMLGNLIRFNLASTRVSHAFAVLLFCDLALKNARRCALFKNIKYNGQAFLDELRAA